MKCNDSLQEFLETKFQELENKLSNFWGEKTNQNEWLTTSQVAKMCSVSQRTVYNWNVNGTLEPKRISGKILYKRQTIEDMLNNKNC
ncbi:MAG: helix-turn-helix domain-containing protein [Bacteroidales bacterium]|nr:helix-turn-helix domain-containing protein [Bacteroidales bacterium]